MKHTKGTIKAIEDFNAELYRFESEITALEISLDEEDEHIEMHHLQKLFDRLCILNSAKNRKIIQEKLQNVLDEYGLEVQNIARGEDNSNEY
jgi:flagellin-specific chaperone FliS